MKNEHWRGANVMDSVDLTLLHWNKAEHFSYITQTKGNKTTVLPETAGWYSTEHRSAAWDTKKHKKAQWHILFFYI